MNKENVGDWETSGRLIQDERLRMNGREMIDEEKNNKQYIFRRLKERK